MFIHFQIISLGDCYELNGNNIITAQYFGNQIFRPGKPQIWYLDLLAGRNDHEAMIKAGSGGHKEINRTNMTIDQVHERLQLPVVQEQLALIRLRNNCPAFGFDAYLEVESAEPHLLRLTWTNHGHQAALNVNLKEISFQVSKT